MDATTKTVAAKPYTASLSKSQGRAGECVIFRHPALRDEASNLRLLMGKFRSARTVRNSCPTAPVAPAMAT